MSAPPDTLSLKLAAARMRREKALKRVQVEDAAIADLLARKRAVYTRQLRRSAHWPKLKSRAEREIDALIAQEVSP
jgi:hypothetical protein